MSSEKNECIPPAESMTRQPSTTSLDLPPSAKTATSKQGVELRICAEDHSDHPFGSEKAPLSVSSRIVFPHACSHRLELCIRTYDSTTVIHEDDDRPDVSDVDDDEFEIPDWTDLLLPEQLNEFHELIEGIFKHRSVTNLILEDMHFYPEGLEYLLQFPLPPSVIWHEMYVPENYRIAKETLAFFEAWQPKHLCFQIESGDALPVPFDQLTNLTYISDLRTFYIGSDNEAGRWNDFDGWEHINDGFLERAMSLRHLQVYTKTGITVDGLKKLLVSWWTGERVFETIVFAFNTGFPNVFNMLKTVLDEHTTYTSEDCHELPGIEAGMSYKFSIVPNQASIGQVDAYMFGTEEDTRIRFIARSVPQEADTWFYCTEPSEWCLLCWYREPREFVSRIPD